MFSLIPSSSSITQVTQASTSTMAASTSMSKRNQARNEQALQELIRGVPGNDRCADCEARNPGMLVC